MFWGHQGLLYFEGTIVFKYTSARIII